ncbi:hypothetical protein ACFL0C_02185 [Patescibacteria group bacterium]
MNFRITKRHKYIIQSLIMVIYLYVFAIDPLERGPLFFTFGAILSLVLSFASHFPNSKVLNTIITNIVSVFLVLGVMLSLYFFPNLSMTFRILSLLVFSAIYYLILLVNNVFLVVEDRGELIPLYRVALTWSKILIAAVTIPLLAGIFKISTLSMFEALTSVLISTVLYLYLVWSLKFNPDVKKYKVGEILTVLSFTLFIVGCASLSVSFIPTESFLRALFVSSVVLFGVSYIEAHLKNAVNRRLISEHLIISFLFLLLLLVFKP